MRSLQTKHKKGSAPSRGNPTKSRRALALINPQQKRQKTRDTLKETELDDEIFRVGDQVYLVLDEALLEKGFEDEEDECYSCGICKSAHHKSKLLECSKCLGGFHLHCLDPPLKEVPEGDWVCSGCSAGRALRHRSVKCARDRVLKSQGLALARITNMWRDLSTGLVEFTAQWYTTPEETHIGRQIHHVAREVFLSRQYDTVSMESVVRHASVIPMAEYNRCGEIADDVFVCDYEYDMVWQRFRKYANWDALDDDRDDDYVEEQSSSSDDDDNLDVYTVVEDVDEESRWPLRRNRSSSNRSSSRKHTGVNKNESGLQKGRKRKNLQGGEDFKIQLGTRAIPDHVRAAQPRGAISQACHALSLAATPKTLPCREEETQQVTEFMEQVLSKGGGGGSGALGTNTNRNNSSAGSNGRCLYISGIPGTGKTATVLQVMRSLRERSQRGEISSFQFIDMNGLRLPTPQHAYSTLYEALSGASLGPQAAAAALEEHFGKPRRSEHHTVVLLDELDSLVNKTQTVLYNLFDWPSRPGSNLTIIGIANTMDLPERLHPRIGSRLAGNRIVFHPYQRDQLVTIMRTRLGGSVFADNAITLVARKVANCSGDVRRCLELCRRAAEIATKRHQEQGLEGDVQVKVR